jgi:hypothetical protein
MLTIGKEEIWQGAMVPCPMESPIGVMDGSCLEISTGRFVVHVLEWISNTHCVVFDIHTAEIDELEVPVVFPGD